MIALPRQGEPPTSTDTDVEDAGAGRAPGSLSAGPSTGLAPISRAAAGVGRFAGSVSAGLELARSTVGPVTLAGQRTLPVLPALVDVVAGPGLRRGATVTVAGLPDRSWGATALALALVAEASRSGSWAAVVGCPELHPVGAAALGVDLCRLALVPSPGRHWATVVGALIDALDVVVAVPPPALRGPDARRLAARARERQAVLIPLMASGGRWVEGADVRLAVVGAEWKGLERGHGLLASRVVEVTGTGRGVAGRERRICLRLPGPDGTVSVAPPHPQPAERGAGDMAVGESSEPDHDRRAG